MAADKMKKYDYSKTGNCYCYACEKHFHPLGIARHRAAHRDKKENCKIMFSDGTVKEWHFGKKE